MEPILDIHNLSHRYGDRIALDGVSLSVQRGEIFGLLGPNGSGKTTLFRILSTLIPLTDGTVRLDGLDLAADRDAIRKRIGVVFQSPSLDKELTAEENLRHHGHLYGLSGGELRERITTQLQRFGLAERRSEIISRFSGGLRRRVELAKGLLTLPAVFLMDEPSTGLDPSARIEMWRALKDARSRDGVTILVTTHLMEEADRCDRLGIMFQGKLVALGTPEQLKSEIGGDIITLTSRDLPALQEAIRKQHAIDAEIVGHVIRIERPAAHQFIPQLVESLPGLIDSVSIGKPTLEDVFIRKTGQRMESADPDEA